MTRFTGFPCAIVLAALVTPALAQVTTIQRAPPVIAQVQAPVAGLVPVAANAGWVATGRTVRKDGQLLVVAGDGRWSVAGKAASVTAVARIPTTGADGFPNTAGQATVLPSANRGALIGRIGAGAPFLIGARYSGVAPADGELFLSVNDGANEFRDNQGALSVVIRATPPRPPAQQPTGSQTPTTPPRAPPKDTTPPETKPPQRDPTPPPQDTQPQTPIPPAQDPTRGPVDTPAPTEEPLPAPEDAPPEAAPLPAAPVTPVAPPIETPPPARPALPEGLVPGAIAVAILAGLLLLYRLMRPRRKPPANDTPRRDGAPAPQIATRIVSDGIADQSLTISVKREHTS